MTSQDPARGSPGSVVLSPVVPHRDAPPLPVSSPPAPSISPPNDWRGPEAVIALVMLLLSPSPRPGGRDHVEGARSGIHRGFTAVSFAGSGARRSVPQLDSMRHVWT